MTVTRPATARNALFARYAYLGWILLAALCAVCPLLVRGTSCGHDLSFHLLNWMEVASQWQHGTLRPFWCFHAAWNAGEPRFVFYPPLSWTLGTLLGLVLPWTATPIAYTLVCLALCGWTMHRLLRDYVSPPAAVLGACLYLANPYALFTAFERTAYAELLAAAWMPLLLYAVFRSRLSVWQLALPVALLWLTNAPAAVIGSYSLLVLGLAHCVQELRDSGWAAVLAAVRKMVCGYVLGLALAGFYLVPAIVQRRLVQIDMAVLPGMRPLDNFLFARLGEPGHDGVLHQASWTAVAILAAAFASAIVLVARRPRHIAYKSMHARGAATTLHVSAQAHRRVLSLAVLTICILFLLTPWSSALWRHAPELRFLQFPWRFLVMAAAAATLLLTKCLPESWPQRTTVSAGLVLALGAGWGAYALYRQPCDEEDTPAAQWARFENARGSEPTDEYTPLAADNDALKSGLPVAWLAKKEDDGPLPDTGVIVVEGRPGVIDISTRPQPEDGYLVIRLRQFAGWNTTLDGRGQPVHSQRNDGLVAVPIAAGGGHMVEVRYQWTWDEYLGLLLTILAVGAALLFARGRPAVPAHQSATPVP